MWMQKHPKLAVLTKVDHFEIGIIIMVISSYFICTAQTLDVFGWVFGIALGTGLTIDDLLLHSFKGYWKHASLFKVMKALLKEKKDEWS